MTPEEKIKQMRQRFDSAYTDQFTRDLLELTELIIAEIMIIRKLMEGHLTTYHNNEIPSTVQPQLKKGQKL